MKVLVVTTIGRTASTFLREQIELLIERGHRVVILCADPEPILDLRGPHLEVRTAPWSRPVRPWALPRAVARTRQLLLADRPDVVYTHTSVASAIVRGAAVTTRDRPIIAYCAHGFDGAQAQPPSRRWPSRAIERLGARVTDLLFVMNAEDEAWARRGGFGRVVRVPSIGLDIDRYRRGSIEPTPYRIVTVAELIQRKRVHLALEVLAALDDRFSLDIVGDGPMRDELVRRAVSLGVDKRVRFLGQVEDVVPVIAAAWLMITTSRQEGLPRSLLEAMAIGTPIVGMPARGVSDLLGEPGTLTTSDDPIEMAAKIIDLAARPSLLEQQRRAGAIAVRQHDVSRVAQLIVDHVEALTP